MNYLFFDIECANCDDGNGKICSFGYVLTDEAFNIIEYTDLIIDPKAKFKLGGRGKHYIRLAYSEECFLAAPPFTYYYERIKSMLTADDTLIFGYAPENDAAFLRSEFERFSLPEVDFKFYDVQRLYKAVVPSENPNMCSLSNACEELQIDTAFITHKSCDDAFATMLVLKELVKRTSKTVKEMLNENKQVCGELKNGEISANYFKPKAELKSGEENFIKGINKDNFKYLVRRLSNLEYSEKICFSWIFEYRRYREMVVLVNKLAMLGYKYTSKLSEADGFVKKPNGMRGICRRERDIYEARRSGFKTNNACIKRRLKIYTFAELLELVGMTEAQLKEEAVYAEKIIEDMKNGLCDKR